LIALAGVLSGAVGVVGGFVFAYTNGKAERLHARQLALTARLHEQRLAAYVEIGQFLERQYLYARDVEFDWQQLTPLPRPDPPDPPSIDEWMTVMGKAKVSASPDVLEALIAVENAVYVLDSAIATKKFFHQDPNAAQIEITIGPHHQIAIEEARNPALEAIGEAERRMRDELAAAT
jgi:hypothetical protein